MKTAVAFDPEFDAPAKGPEKARRRRRWLLVALVDVGILCPFLLLLMGPSVNSWYFVPSRPPEETHRVVHPKGFSIVAPPGWETKIGVSAPFDSITAAARQLRPDRLHRAEIRLVRFGTAKPRGASDPDFRPVSFQGRPARERTWSYANRGKDPTPWYDYELDFQRDGQWYTLEYEAPRQYQSLPPMIQRYFNTFRHESPPQDTEILPNEQRTKDNGQRTKDP